MDNCAVASEPAVVEETAHLPADLGHAEVEAEVVESVIAASPAHLSSSPALEEVVVGSPAAKSKSADPSSPQQESSGQQVQQTAPPNGQTEADAPRSPLALEGQKEEEQQQQQHQQHQQQQQQQQLQQQQLQQQPDPTEQTEGREEVEEEPHQPKEQAEQTEQTDEGNVSAVPSHALADSADDMEVEEDADMDNCAVASEPAVVEETAHLPADLGHAEVEAEVVESVIAASPAHLSSSPALEEVVVGSPAAKSKSADPSSPQQESSGQQVQQTAPPDGQTETDAPRSPLALEGKKEEEQQQQQQHQQQQPQQLEQTQKVEEEPQASEEQTEQKETASSGADIDIEDGAYQQQAQGRAWYAGVSSALFGHLGR